MTKASDVILLAAARRAAATGEAAELRRRAGLSQADMAKPVGVTPQAVARWEHGTRVPRGKAALRYARLLRRLGLRLDDGSVGTGRS